MIKMKAMLFIVLTITVVATGALSISILMSCSKEENSNKNFSLPSKSETYKSVDKSTKTEIKLNYKDSTYSYHENYIMKAGDDVGYESKSKGKFKMDKDTLIFYTDMPSNDMLDYNIHHLTNEEIAKNKFSYIYPIDEKVNSNQVKIYFDNIAEIDDYKAFTIIKNQLKPLQIIERKKLEQEKLIKTKNDNFFLFHYLIIEKPKNNQLLITGSRSESFLFDFDKIPYSAFHFYTRVYWNCSDFTGLRFLKTDKSLKRIINPDDKRYEVRDALNSAFIKQ